jgi:hopene-associated glycosyltransferase HpnB
MIVLCMASLACAAWLYLLLLRGGFWRAAERDDIVDNASFTPDAWPRVTAVLPARNEAEVIAITIGSLLRQDYPGTFRIVVVDDHSNDETAAIARHTATAVAAADRLVVLSAPNLPAGWTGKLWAMNSGASYVDASPQPPDYLLFIDADISCAADTLTALVKRAERGSLVLTSLMAKLHCESLAERALIPAFIFFFRMLYPFAWVNRPELTTAAAAGGCMLVRRQALQRAGGIAALRGELIDDCALGRLLKKQGPIWLGLTDRARSLRAFGSIGDIRPMICRSAYAQLRYSPWLLIGTMMAMALVFVAPPLLAIGSTGIPQWLGAAAWVLMAFAMQPTLRFYGVSRWWGLALPAIACVYLAFTLDSAWQHWRGRGGMWKGRTHVPEPDRR